MELFEAQLVNHYMKKFPKTFPLLDPGRVPAFSLLSMKPVHKEFRLYIDVDGVLIGQRDPARKRKAVAFGAVDFFSFAKSNFDCYWLTPHCRGDAAEVRAYIARHYSNRGDLDYLLTKVRPTTFATPRTRLFAQGEKFYWLTPEITQEEEEDLESRGLFNNHIQIDTRKDWKALDGVRDFLREELRRDD